jgi:hypothetical protein
VFKTKDAKKFADERLAIHREGQEKLPRCNEKLPVNRAWQR